MSNIEQLESAYAEYNSILAQYKNYEVIEDKEKLILRINNIS
ncbi:hypothetical protein [Lysinibacillus fusiformis]|nr:hypothetical protein [Lysinibacillus fusiformis]